jgi:hypothetical protein
MFAFSEHKKSICLLCSEKKAFSEHKKINLLALFRKKRFLNTKNQFACKHPTLILFVQSFFPFRSAGLVLHVVAFPGLLSIEDCGLRCDSVGTMMEMVIVICWCV